MLSLLEKLQQVMEATLGKGVEMSRCVHLGLANLVCMGDMLCSMESILNKMHESMAIALRDTWCIGDGNLNTETSDDV